MARLTRVMETTMAMLQAAADRSMNITVVNKALFYADLIALRDLGKTITREPYVALEQGPVVESYDQKLVESLRQAGLAEQVQLEKAKPLRVVAPLNSFDLLSDKELRIATIFGEKMQFTSAKVSAFSHDNPGWKLAFKRYTKGRPAPHIDLVVAMQQVMDDDPWLDEPFDDATRHIAEHVRTGVSHEW